MNISVNMHTVYKPSEKVIAKNLEGRIMIVPLVSGVGNLDDELFQLNETGSAVWEMLDGKNRLIDIANTLSKEYEAPCETIERDILALIDKLMEKKFVIEAP